MTLVFHWGWERVEGTLVDKRFVERGSFNVERPSTSYQVWEYLVEVPGVGGQPVRLLFQEKSFEVDNPAPGDAVPVVVNKKRTKAAFDLSDPRIGFRAARKAGKAQDQAHQAEEKARLERKRRSPGT